MVSCMASHSSISLPSIWKLSSRFEVLEWLITSGYQGRVTQLHEINFLPKSFYIDLHLKASWNGILVNINYCLLVSYLSFVVKLAIFYKNYGTSMTTIYFMFQINFKFPLYPVYKSLRYFGKERDKRGKFGSESFLFMPLIYSSDILRDERMKIKILIWEILLWNP